MFQEALQFNDVIILCYKKPNIVNISGRVSSFLIWNLKKNNGGFFSLLWMLVFWTNLVATIIIWCIVVYHYHVLKKGKKLQTHLRKLIWLMMIIGLFLNCLCLLSISRGKSMVLLNLSFLFQKIWKKKITQHTMFDVWF